MGAIWRGASWFWGIDFSEILIFQKWWFLLKWSFPKNDREWMIEESWVITETESRVNKNGFFESLMILGIIWVMSHDSWLMIHYSWFMFLTHDSWFLTLKTHDSWLFTHDSWLMIHDSWFLTHDSWFLTHDSWFMIRDSWFMILDSWFMIHQMGRLMYSLVKL